MYRWIILLLLFAAGKHLSAQKLEVTGLIDMLDWNTKHIDTTLKKKGYLLMHKDIDSINSLYQYSEVDRPKDEAATVRTFSYMDVRVQKLTSRLITYRTYDKEEFGEISSFLLNNNYHATG